MPTLCTYVLTHDSGLAPNPFWGWCTLAVCTPNRQGARLQPSDFIAGFSPLAAGNRLIYMMEVAERIHMNSYYHDKRFLAKRPNLQGSWQERCGDNFYSHEANGKWKQHRNRFHLGADYLAKDTRRPFVFVSQRFWYFGQLAPHVPRQFHCLVGARGIRVAHPPKLVQEFTTWVSSSYEPGVRGQPASNPDAVA
jgi:Nucleotide modification associated domain 2